MHFEILVEDQSGEKTLNILIPKIIGNEHTFNVHSYKGIGRIPRNLNANLTDANRRFLLTQLPKLLDGYGKTYAGYHKNYQAAVIVICDLDDKCLTKFRNELNNILNNCNTKPITRFCIAIEEGEAWFLGDIQAIKSAYPKAKNKILNAYKNDAICGTWECLADAIYKGGSVLLSKKGWQAVGLEKSRWAEKISPHMNVEKNESPSFNYLRQKLNELLASITLE
ncbi:MAG: DUF4276 family protein [Planctomycetaceae bacterium]|jgi:hypothetical protein|nr:DUF4276 family protein [Planctomycetaceae bacterium]